MIIFYKKYLITLQKKVLLQIIKNNKRIQKRLHININTYKEYFEIFTPIELEIIPMQNGEGKFINIKKEDKDYFYIYLMKIKKKRKENI